MDFTAAHRIVRRYLTLIRPDPTRVAMETRSRKADALINLYPPPVAIPDNGVITTGDVEHVLRTHDIDARGVRFERTKAANETLWTGHDAHGHAVMGRLLVRSEHDGEHIRVAAEITLASTVLAAADTEIPMRQRLLLIESIARRAIVDLQQRPDEVGRVAEHLLNVVGLAKQGAG